MKIIPPFILMMAVALDCFGQAVQYDTQILGTAALAGSVLWWQGSRYELKDVAANDEQTITFDTNRGKLRVPWDQVPEKIQGECSDDRQKELKATAAATARANIAALGVVKVSGDVIQVTDGGVLLDKGNGQNEFLKGVTGVADGDHLFVWAKPIGTLTYATVLGATATVRAYNYVSDYTAASDPQ